MDGNVKPEITDAIVAPGREDLRTQIQVRTEAQ
jgi:hypothetical protein